MELPMTIKEQVANYYTNRQNQKERYWDKYADLDRIGKACDREGWGYEATAGIFWFSKKEEGSTTVIKILESTFPEGGVTSVLKPGEPFGLFSEITTALEKKGKKPRFTDARPHTLTIDGND